jgi:hypothetical protein
VPVAAFVGASLLAACGGGGPDRATTRDEEVAAVRRSAGRASDRANLRSPDVDGRMDPVSSATVFACPHTGRVEVFFDPRGTVALIANGRPLVDGTAGTRAVSRRCRSRGRRHGVLKGVLSERTEATTLNLRRASFGALRGPSQHRFGRRGRNDGGPARGRSAPHRALGGPRGGRVPNLPWACVPDRLTPDVRFPLAGQ